MKDVVEMSSVPVRLREVLSTGDLTKLSNDKILKYLREYAELKYGPHKVVRKHSTELTEKEMAFIRKNYKTMTQADMATALRSQISRVGEYVRNLKADEYEKELSSLVYEKYETVGRERCRHEYTCRRLELFRHLSSRSRPSSYSSREIDRIFIEECIKHGRSEEEARSIVARSIEVSV